MLPLERNKLSNASVWIRSRVVECGAAGQCGILSSKGTDEREKHAVQPEIPKIVSFWARDMKMDGPGYTHISPHYLVINVPSHVILRPRHH